MITKQIFGQINDKEVFIYTIDNNKIKASILTYGGILQSLIVPSANSSIDVVLGYSDINDYVLDNDTYFGAVIGRNANRIKDGKFVLDNKEYQLNINNNGCCNLHGGINGFNKKIFEVIKVDDKNHSITLKTTAKDGEEFFPGNVELFVTYTLNDCSLEIEYSGNTDKPTPFNITNHSYFNLDGEGTATCHDSMLKINADYYTPTDSNLVPTGEILSLKNTPYNFKEFKKINKDINADDIGIKNMLGYDLNYCLNKDQEFSLACEVYSESTKIFMEVFTTERGMQLYSGAYVTERKGKNGHTYNKNQSICLETQNYPDTYNNCQFGSSILKPTEKYSSKTIYKFSVK